MVFSRFKQGHARTSVKSRLVFLAGGSSKEKVYNFAGDCNAQVHNATVPYVSPRRTSTFLILFGGKFPKRASPLQSQGHILSTLLRQNSSSH